MSSDVPFVFIVSSIASLQGLETKYSFYILLKFFTSIASLQGLETIFISYSSYCYYASIASLQGLETTAEALKNLLAAAFNSLPPRIGNHLLPL